MDLVSRLKQYLDANQISVTQFADECSIPRPTGSQLLAGRNKKVSDEIIGKIHAAYPNLSIVWLMFGEGNMETAANIETSEAQNQGILDFQDTEPLDKQIDSIAMDFSKNSPENMPEKIGAHQSSNFMPDSNDMDRLHADTAQTHPARNTFSFTHTPDVTPGQAPKETAPQPGASSPSPQAEATLKNNDSKDDSITVTPGKGKRVTGIVVYYDDSTYESFIPDPTHGHPFMR